VAYSRQEGEDVIIVILFLSVITGLNWVLKYRIYGRVLTEIFNLCVSGALIGDAALTIVTEQMYFLTPWRQNPQVRHCIHNSRPPVPILSQLNPH
jgi:hypothetical protein